MKKLLVSAFLLLSFAHPSTAAEITYDDLLSDPSRYVNKTVTMSGLFMYSDPVRESFTFEQRGNRVEVFYRNLPQTDKMNILAQQKYSKAEVSVSGILHRYANSQSSFFINASSLRLESGSSPVPANAIVVTYADVLSEPSKYLKTTITMKGMFLYSDAIRQSFTFNQNGTPVEALIGDLSKLDRDALLSLKEYSMTPVTVTGVLQPYKNKPKAYFMNAQAVIIEK